MALSTYLQGGVATDSNGDFSGDCEQAGREGWMEIHAWDGGVVSPRDAASGLPTGKRRHKEFSILKDVDQASPILMAVLCGNGNIAELNFNMFRPSIGGDEEHFFSITLKDATVSHIHQEMLDNKFPDNMNIAIRERVKFCFRSIVWSHVVASKETEDDWRAPRGA